MVDRICVVLEALSIAVCLHRLYGKKFRFDIATVSLMTIEMIMMQAIDYFGWPKELSMLFYPIIAVYCVIEFGFDLKELIINNVLNAIIICIFQMIVLTVLYVFINQQIIVGIGQLISNFAVLMIIVFILPHFSMRRLVDLLKDKENILSLALVVSVSIMIFLLVNYKNINYVNHIDFLQYILFVTCIIMIGMLILRIGKYKIKSKEIETELKMHMLYANSFDNLIDNIRSRQHEFDNHINTIYSQHYIYHTYEELVEAQKKYSQLVTGENQFNKLLVSGNPVIIGFLYGKFIEIDKLGIDISYHISVGELKVKIPIYKLVEIIGNLISNAVEALVCEKKYNKLYVFLEEDDGKLSIEVRNESDYISFADIDLFFTKGYSKKGKNRGLGLFHVKSICNEYNLNLLCQNKEIDEANWISFMISSKKETM